MNFFKQKRKPRCGALEEIKIFGIIKRIYEHKRQKRLEEEKRLLKKRKRDEEISRLKKEIAESHKRLEERSRLMDELIREECSEEYTNQDGSDYPC